MRPEDLVFWIDALPDPVDDAAAVLCRRHADAMVVPRGWTLDDLRDPDLHLFRPPLLAPTARQRVTRQRREPAGGGEQLRLGVQPGPLTDGDASAPSAVEDDGDGAAPWAPSFDEADDLDGLLAARGPLLSRAFRTAERPAE
jgi:hypothetical protein